MESPNQPTEQDKAIANLITFIASEAEEGKNKSEIIEELTEAGLPHDEITGFVDRVFEYKSEFERKEEGKEGKKSIGCGLLMLIVGALLSYGSYSAAAPGETYFVTTGLFIVGAITLLIGLYIRISA